MDPLSVLASVVGLLSAAVQVSSILSAMKSSVDNAPQLVSDVMSEIKELEISLSAIQTFLQGINLAPKQRIALIPLDHLIATLTEAVLTFSELEILVSPFAKQSKISTRDLFKWAGNENKLSIIMQRLQRHKSSLSLMLNIVQCGSDLLAEESRDTLQNLIEQLLESSYDISRRLRSIENSCDSQRTLTRYLSDNSVGMSEAEISIDVPDALDPNEISLKSFDFQFENTELSQTNKLSFENDLKLSRVYSRTQLYDCDVSFTTSAARTHAWSVHTGLSLADASVISAIALPVYSQDISNSQWYQFGEINGPKQRRTSTTRGTASNASAAKVNLKRSTSAVSKIRDYASEIRRFPRRKLPPSSRKEPARTKLYKIIVLGDDNVGTSELVTQLHLTHPSSSYSSPNAPPTAPQSPSSIASHKIHTKIDTSPCILEILNPTTASSLRENTIRNSNGFILVYSIYSRASFTSVARYHRQISKVKDSVMSEFFNLPYVPAVVIGYDHRAEGKEGRGVREVKKREGEALARELGCGFSEMRHGGCLSNEVGGREGGVEVPFWDVVRLIRRSRG